MARLPRGFYKRGKIWWYRTDPVTGGPISTGCKTGQAATVWLKRRELIAADPDYAAAQAAELGEWVQRTLELKSRTSSESTQEVYRQKLGHFVRIWGAGKRLAEVSPGLVDRYVAQRRSERVSDHTITKELVCLGAVLKLAKRSKCYPGDIATLKPPELRAGYVPQTRALTRQEVVRLLAELSPERGAYVALCVGLGVRRSEVERLLPSDVDLDKGEVFVGGTKTAGAKRHVPILSIYRQLVQGALPHMPVGSWGNAIRDLAAACRRAGIERCTRNDLRRSHSTILHELGVDRDVIRRLLGHTTTRMVDSVYAKPSPEALGVLAERQLVAVDPIQICYSNATRPDGQASATLAQLVEQRFRKPSGERAVSGESRELAGFPGRGRSPRAQHGANRGTESLHDPLEAPSLMGLARAAHRLEVLPGQRRGLTACSGGEL